MAGDKKANEPPPLAMRDGNWKLFAQPDGSRVELYDIPADPEERNNLSEQNPEVVKRLLPELLAWKLEAWRTSHPDRRAPKAKPNPAKAPKPRP